MTTPTPHTDNRTASRNAARYPQRLHADEAREARHRKDAEPPPEDPAALDGGDAPSIETEEFDDGQRVKVGNCWYRTRDKTAGVRAYIRHDRVKRFWHGFVNNKAIDHYTGAPVAVQVVSASVQEYNAYPDLLDASIHATGAKPRAVVADRGLSLEQIFELNTKQGIASIIRWRKRGSISTRKDTDEYDRHGIPRCRGCGGPTRYLRFAAEPYPRIWFRCELPVDADCHGDQSISCSKDWRTLLPLWRTEEAYFALRESHGNYERVHRVWRERYKVGAATHEMRPKRMGAGWQQLRASAALLIEWLRVLEREGWNGSARRNRNNPKRDLIGEQAVRRLRKARRVAGLTAPYGPVAVAVGLGPNRPAEPPG